MLSTTWPIESSHILQVPKDLATWPIELALHLESERTNSQCDLNELTS